MTEPLANRYVHRRRTIPRDLHAAVQETGLSIHECGACAWSRGSLLDCLLCGDGRGRSAGQLLAVPVLLLMLCCPEHNVQVLVCTHGLSDSAPRQRLWLLQCSNWQAAVPLVQLSGHRGPKYHHQCLLLCPAKVCWGCLIVLLRLADSAQASALHPSHAWHSDARHQLPATAVQTTGMQEHMCKVLLL